MIISSKIWFYHFYIPIQFTLSRDGNVQQSSDDWEVKMLVEQFDAKMKKRSLEGKIMNVSCFLSVNHNDRFT